MARDRKKLRGKVKAKIQGKLKIPPKILKRLDELERSEEDVVGCATELRDELAALAIPLRDPEPLRVILAKLLDGLAGKSEEEEHSEEEHHEESNGDGSEE